MIENLQSNLSSSSPISYLRLSESPDIVLKDSSWSVFNQKRSAKVYTSKSITTPTIINIITEKSNQQEVNRVEGCQVPANHLSASCTQLEDPSRLIMMELIVWGNSRLRFQNEAIKKNNNDPLLRPRISELLNL